MPRQPWNRNLVSCLAKSEEFGLAKVKIEQTPRIIYIGKVKIPRPEAGVIIKVNDQIIYLDCWDYGRPTTEVLRLIENLDMDIKLIIKIQRRESFEFSNKKNIPVLPWSMFHTNQLRWLANQPKYKQLYEDKKDKEIRIGFSGRVWKHRRPWIDAIRKIEGGHFHTWRGKVPKDPIDNYIDVLCNWQSMMLMQGKRDKFTDGKNRREVECASMGLPMIMNYKPYYLNELTPGKHYILVTNYSKMEEALSGLTPEFARELAGNAYNWWEANASMEGLCKTFLQCAETVGII